MKVWRQNARQSLLNGRGEARGHSMEARGREGQQRKKRVRNFTPNDRAAHRVFERSRREAFREQLIELASLLPGLAEADPNRLSKHEVIQASIQKHYEQAERIRELEAERDRLAEELQNAVNNAALPIDAVASDQPAENIFGDVSYLPYVPPPVPQASSPVGRISDVPPELFGVVALPDNFALAVENSLDPSHPITNVPTPPPILQIVPSDQVNEPWSGPVVAAPDIPMQSSGNGDQTQHIDSEAMSLSQFPQDSVNPAIETILTSSMAFPELEGHDLLENDGSLRTPSIDMFWLPA